MERDFYLNSMTIKNLESMERRVKYYFNSLLILARSYDKNASINLNSKYVE